MFEPRLCQCDSEGSLLIADPKNENMQVSVAHYDVIIMQNTFDQSLFVLQILTAEGKWHIIHFNDNVKTVVGGWFLRRGLFVVQSADDFKLLKCTS